MRRTISGQLIVCMSACHSFNGHNFSFIESPERGCAATHVGNVQQVSVELVHIHETQYPSDEIDHLHDVEKAEAEEEEESEAGKSFNIKSRQHRRHTRLTITYLETQ